MSYVHIDPATKMKAVKHFWQTGNLKKSAEKFDISRKALYAWGTAGGRQFGSDLGSFHARQKDRHPDRTKPEAPDTAR